MISREQFAITKIKPRSGASFAVSISVEVKKDSWLLELKKTDEKVVGPKRLRLALTQLVLGNAAWIQKLRNGHIVGKPSSDLPPICDYHIGIKNPSLNRAVNP